MKSLEVLDEDEDDEEDGNQVMRLTQAEQEEQREARLKMMPRGVMCAELWRRIHDRRSEKHMARQKLGRETNHTERMVQLRKRNETEKAMPELVDPPKALKWYQAAAEAELQGKVMGRCQAMLMLGICEWEGECGSVDLVKAEPWFNKAKTYGDAAADRFLKKCNGHAIGMRWKEGTRPEKVEHLGRSDSKPLAAPRDIDMATENNASFYGSFLRQELEKCEPFLHPFIEYSTIRSEPWRGTSVYRKYTSKGRSNVMQALKGREPAHLARRWSLFEEVERRIIFGTPEQEKLIQRSKERSSRARAYEVFLNPDPNPNTDPNLNWRCPPRPRLRG